MQSEDVRLVRHIVGEYYVAHPSEATRSRPLVQFLDSSASNQWRDSTSQHVTASSIIVAIEQQTVALVWNPSYARWLPPGGHVERDEFPSHAAFREAAEEVGLDLGVTTAWEVPFDIDVHPAHPGSIREVSHFDMRYLRLVEGQRQLTPQLSEVEVAEWFPIGDITVRRALGEACQRKVVRHIGGRDVGQAKGIRSDS